MTRQQLRGRESRSNADWTNLHARILPAMLASLKRAALYSGRVAVASRRVALLGSPITSSRAQVAAYRTQSSHAEVSAQLLRTT